ncbi:threonine/serine exporter family protein [Chitiniphilus shinanonensis]|uniref:threonine/serine exporter family protein n=1 Tax=Chitiniphilus shinanonensis TaxID=553088 RepID=UPI00305EDE27
MKTVRDPTHLCRLVLFAGTLVHQSGGDTARTANIMTRTARALGAENVHTVVSSLNLGITVELNSRQRTVFHKAPHMGVNFRTLTGVSRAVNALEARRIGPTAFETLLDDLASRPHYYPRWFTAFTVGLACGGFAALFGGDLAAVLATLVGAGLGSWVRLWMTSRHYKPFIFAIASSTVATLLVGLLAAWLSYTPEPAIAASVLFLIPGVPLINAMADMLSGNYLNGGVRLTMSAVIIAGIGVGVSLALRVFH